MEIEKKAIIKWLGAVVLMLVLPNIIFWIVSPGVYLIRGVFVMEYFILACLYPYISRKLFITLWLLFAIYDMVYSSTSLFFMGFAEIIHALAKLPKIPFTSFLLWTGLLLLLLSLTWLLVRLLIRYNKTVPFLHPRFILPLLFVCLIIDFFNPQGRNKRWALLSVHRNIVSTPSWSFINTFRFSLKKQQIEKTEKNYLGSIAQKVFDKVPHSVEDKKELLVMVESWGLLKDKDLHNEVLKPMYDLLHKQQYRINEGANRYRYLTQAGELREITGYLSYYYQADNEFNKQNSLFFKKQQQGYHVVGVHGFSYEFYNRQRIWPELGIQEMYFSDKLKEASLPECGNQFFTGICDTAICTWLLNYAKKQPDRKEFFYWVTLNTHLPLEERTDNDYKQFAKKWEQKGIKDKILQLAYQHKLLFGYLAKQLSDPVSPKVHVLLVGDHAPPFIDPDERNMYDNNNVPWVELRPFECR